MNVPKASAAPAAPGDRRPIAARGWAVWQRTAAGLARRGVSPNSISLAGMLCGLLAGAAFAATRVVETRVGDAWEPLAWLAAALLIQLRLLANLLDGMVAVEGGKASATGPLYNDVPDRPADAAALIGAGYAVGGLPALGYLAACAALFTAYVRAVGKAAGASSHFVGPMAKQHRMALLTAAAVLLAALPPRWRPAWGESGIGFGEDGPGLVAAALLIVIAGGLLTAARRLSRSAGELNAAASVRSEGEPR